jgi:hypothetical protein
VKGGFNPIFSCHRYEEPINHWNKGLWDSVPSYAKVAANHNTGLIVHQPQHNKKLHTKSSNNGKGKAKEKVPPQNQNRLW